MNAEPQQQESLDLKRRTMLYWLSRTLRTAREAAGFEIKDVLPFVPVKEVGAIRRFEDAKHWPRQVDIWVAAYAYLLGLDDGRKLWERAVRSYLKDGGAPVLGELSPQLRAVLLAVEANERFGPADDGSPAAPSTRRKRT